MPLTTVPPARSVAGGGLAPWYVGAALTRARATLRSSAVAATAALAVAGCGGERRDAGVADRTYTVTVERASFPLRQRLARRNSLVLRVRNAGDETIPNLVVTLRGFTDRKGGARNADPTRDLWIVDSAPAGAGTAFEDRWSAGPLEPGRTQTLRWDVTPVVAGRHVVTYAIAPTTSGPARVQLAGGGEAQRSLTVRVTDKPATSRVDPRTGEVRRKE